MGRRGSPTPWSYFFVRLLFKFVLKIFYGSIVVENANWIPENGEPCIVVANHSNSLTDALLIVTSIPGAKRNLIRLTAKATQFGKRTFTSWLIESAGTVPIKRAKDSPEGKVDNNDVFVKLMEALEQGDAVLLFPEGMSRYHPTIAPLKTGVARIVSDVLSRNKNEPQFKISILTCSITYMHREHFRSDVLITFHPPLSFTPQSNPELIAPVDFTHIRSLTSRIRNEISSGTIDSPSWDIVRSAKLASRIYAPLGTAMSLGDYVRICRIFVEVFKWAEDEKKESIPPSSRSEEEDEQSATEKAKSVNLLRQNLKIYQDELSNLGIKDDRIRRPIPRRTILRRIFVRAAWMLFLCIISFPGLILWLPIFASAQYGARKYSQKGPVWDTWDEIAQHKLVFGLISGICVWLTCILVTLPMAPVTATVVPLVMWMTLRWLEDAVSAGRAFVALTKLLWVGKRTLHRMYEQRMDLHTRIMLLAVDYLGLPNNPETVFAESGGREKGRVRGPWERRAKYFSLRRRRKRDWNETLRLYDKVNYPELEH
ncbi:hypothetical protein BD410DRAFT_764512 [Rickenella mellea]|uniref:Phospholipid/glycerol acyltransferase domain-containing protein n=1 Tax=Rickenella mellea TaxID=50990 RepID=A0A4Y7QFX1_9AGAM|nr:hypothetical protein BD410DRAFT_764512 [Rickenella mellea]